MSLWCLLPWALAQLFSWTSFNLHVLSVSPSQLWMHTEGATLTEPSLQYSANGLVFCSSRCVLSNCLQSVRCLLTWIVPLGGCLVKWAKDCWLQCLLHCAEHLEVSHCLHVLQAFLQCVCASVWSLHILFCQGLFFTAVVSSFLLHSLVSLSFLGADLIIWYRMSYYLNDHIHYFQSQVKWCTWVWVMDISFLVNYPVQNWTHNIHVWGGGGLNIFILLPVQNCTHGMHTVWVKKNSCCIIYAVLQVCWFITKIQTHKRFKRCCFVGQNTTCKFSG